MKNHLSKKHSILLLALLVESACTIARGLIIWGILFWAAYFWVGSILLSEAFDKLYLENRKALKSCT